MHAMCGGKPGWWWIMDDASVEIAAQLRARSHCVIDEFLAADEIALFSSEVRMC